MSKKNSPVYVLVITVLFTILFYHHPVGINIFIFTIIVLAALYYQTRFSFKNTYLLVVFTGALLSAFSVLINLSYFGFTINVISLFLFAGILILPETGSLVTPLRLSVNNTIASFGLFFKNLGDTRLNGQKLGSRIWRARFFIFPVLIILVFVGLYRHSNPWFHQLLENVGSWLHRILSTISFGIILTILLGICTGIFLFYRAYNHRIIELSSALGDNMIRKKINKRGVRRSMLGLRNELRAAVFLFGILNIILLIVNSMDVYWVWFNFEWNGQYLKQFVHEGTYLLIISILLSIVIVLFFFRRNLNFYSENKILKLLSYIWLGQNAVLTVSVGIRNFWYIHYFALAYKRIGVIVFLLLTLYGIYTVFQKVKDMRTAYFLFKRNILAVYLMLLACGMVNWDSLIARYNFSNWKTAFVHLNYLSSLSFKALPYLDKSAEELYRIEEEQQKLFPFESRYMSPEEFMQRIRIKKQEFKKSWESKSFLSWNLAEYRAYKKLKFE